MRICKLAVLVILCVFCVAGNGEEAQAAFHLPEGLQTIQASAFEGDLAITAIDIPSKVTRISDRAFAGCTNLKEAVIPASVTQIGENAFEGCDDLLIVCTVGSYAQQYAQENQIRCSAKPQSGLTYTVHETYVEITGYEGSDDAIVVPAQIEGKPVTVIGEDAFLGSHITAISLPEGLVEIGCSAFLSCTKLTSIVLPDSVEKIGSFAFNWCKNLSSVNYPSNWTTVTATEEGYTGGPFQECPKLTSIEIPQEVKTIASYAFKGCESLQTVRFSDGLQKISDHAFYGCDSLTSIELPDSIEVMGPYAFAYCDNLRKINYPRNWKYVERIDFDDGSFIEGCVFIGSPLLTTMIVPEGVTGIPDKAFMGWEELESISLPDSLLKIGVGTFEGCKNLRTVTLPDSIECLGAGAFENCSQLTSVNYPRNLTSIDDTADGDENLYYGFGPFARCSNLTFMEVPEGVTMIPDKVFQESSLRTIILPDTLYEIGFMAFGGCDNLRQLVLPDGVFRINGCAFGYSALEQIMIPEGVYIIDWSTFSGCSSLHSVYIPESVIHIDETAFEDANQNLVIYGESGSYAQSYAEENNLAFSIAPLPEKDYGERAHSLVASVLSPDRTSIGGATVEVLLPGEQTIVKSAVTDANGTAVIDGLQQRVYVLRCTHPLFLYEEKYLYLNAASTQAVFEGKANGGYLITPLNSYAAAQTGESISFPVAASQAWSAEAAEEWLTLGNTSGMPGGTLFVTAAANAGALRTGEIVLRSGALTHSVYIQQTGALGGRLPDPVITYPAANGDAVAYGPISVTWNAVEGAGSYVISLRDLGTNQLLVHHQKMSDQLSVELNPLYFDDGHQYRVAVGAVPPGAESTDASVSWCERVFNVSQYVSTEAVTFTGTVYELYDAVAVSTLSEGASTWALSSGIDFKGAYDCTVAVYHLNKAADENAWEFVTETVTDEKGRYSITEGLTAGEEYRFIFTKTDYSFIGDIEQLTYTAQHGETQVVDTYCFSTEIEEQVEAFRSIRGFDITGRPNGLFAEYFAFSDKNKAFTAANKRNEEKLDTAVDFSWKGETFSSGFWISGTELSYYQLHASNYAEEKEIGTLNYVPFKFAARFNGYLKLKGADDANALMSYKFRVRGDDGVRLQMELPSYESYVRDQWSSRGLAENESVIDMSSVGYLNGTVFKVCIEYYNKSNGGDAKLIFEYSTDKGKTWQTVPYTWLYEGDRTVSIMTVDESNGVNEVVGVDYAAKLAKSNDQLINYNDRLVCNMLKDLAGMSVNSSVKAYNTGTTIFGDAQLTASDRMAMFWQQRLGKKAAKAVYTAVFEDVCEIDAEETIWEKIGEQMSKQFGLKVDTVYNTTNTAIDSIATLQSVYAALTDNASSNASILSMQSAILDNIELYTIGDLKDLDSSDETASAGYSAFFELSGTKRKALETETLKLDSGVRQVWGFADQGRKLLETLYGTDNANTNRAVLALMFAETGKTPDFFKASLDMVENDGGATLWKLFDNKGNPYTYNNREEFESKLNVLTNKSLNTLFARMQDVDLEELLYKDLLKITLDTAYTYYKNLFKFGL